ncbi:MAG: hypothetical protein ACOYOT_07170 [Bacteroidales bacterium]
MNVTLRYEDLFTLQQCLQWEFQNTETEVDVNSLRKIILDSFQEAANVLNLKDTIPFSTCDIDIKLVMRGVQGNTILAYFDMNNLTVQSTCFSFKLYADVLFPLLKSGDLHDLKSIWVHEIMHLLDYRELLTNLKLCREKKIERYTSCYNKTRNDKHIILIDLLMHFRAEGIATLVGYALDDSKSPLVPSVEAAEKFTEIIDYSFSLINAVESNSTNLAQFIKQVRPFAYQIGAGVVLQGLMKKHPDFAIFREIDQCIENNKPFRLTTNEPFISDIRQFNSFNFIEYCFDHEWLYERMNELTSNYADNLHLYSGFFGLLNRVLITNDRDGFVALLGQLIDASLTMNQMKELYENASTDDTIPSEVKENMAILYQYLRQNPTDNICLLALTYLFACNDLLDDTIEYFGYIDDLDVLITARHLIEN